MLFLCQPPPIDDVGIRCYHNDMDESKVTYEQGVDLCNRAGMRYLSFAKKAERGVVVDETEVKHDIFLLYLEAAKSGLPRAHYNLAVCYHFGIGVGVDHEEAIKHYEKAIAGGSSEALVYLAKMYALGEGVEIDRAKSDALMKEAAEKGNPTACFILGGQAANDKNSTLALSYFKKAAENHMKFSYCASLNEAQSGKDYESARDGVGKSLAKCLFFASYLTILVLRVKEDFEKAVEWLKISFYECEMPEAAIVLAHVYTYGEGVRQDFEEAEKYVKLAEDHKLHGAEDARDDLEEVRARSEALKKNAEK